MHGNMTCHQTVKLMLYRQFFDDKLAQYSYLIGCPATGEAIVIDPERDIDRYMAAAAAENLEIVAVADTHIHADYVTGVREFAERYGTKLYMSDEGAADWKYLWLDDGDYDYELLTDGSTFRVGNIEIEAVHTPGHTPEHLSYLVTDLGGGATDPMGLATGDFVFVGDVGRPDLLESAAGQAGTMEPAARSLYGSIERFKELPPELQVWPGHGAGSACGKALGAVPQSTIGYELKFNASIKEASTEDRFVDFILSDQPEPPMYFARMKRVNKEGPSILGELPDPQEISRERLQELAGRTDIAVIDTREAEAFMRGHLPGSLLAPLNRAFNTVVGSFVEEATPIYLIAESDRVREAVIDLIRIGLDDVVGFISPETLNAYAESGGELATVETIGFQTAEERQRAGDGRILDVRSATEYREGHLHGAINIAHTRLYVEKDRLSKDESWIVHCQSGPRSAVSAGLLDRYGYEVAFVDQELDNYRESGGTFETSEAVADAV
jgi:hydroxyacylglutathione hydrolase